MGQGAEFRDLTTELLESADGRALVELRVAVRDSGEGDWYRLRIEVPVTSGADGRWQVPSLASIDRLARADLALIDTAAQRGLQTPVPTSQPEEGEPAPTATRPEMPPPPEGTVLYASDWTAGMDGWIGTPDWRVRDGMLVNDGTRSSRDPWIEAPVQVEPWQSMVVEFQAEVTAQGYASFGLISRAGSAGWFHFGVRWDPGVGAGGAHVAAMGQKVRRETRMVHEELVAAPRPLDPGPHYYRAEFRDGVATFFIDGQKVGELPEGEFQPGEFLGLWSELTPLEVHFFRVTLV